MHSIDYSTKHAEDMFRALERYNFICSELTKIYPTCKVTSFQDYLGFQSINSNHSLPFFRFEEENLIYKEFGVELDSYYQICLFFKERLPTIPGNFFVRTKEIPFFNVDAYNKNANVTHVSIDLSNTNKLNSIFPKIKQEFIKFLLADGITKLSSSPHKIIGNKEYKNFIDDFNAQQIFI